MNGETLTRQLHLLVVSVQLAANRLSRARLIYQDGSAASSDFPLSNSESFLPGNEIEILVGAGGEEQSIFKGLVVKQALKIRENSAAQLVVDCRHKAVAMTRSKNSAYYLQQTDSDIINDLMTQYDVAGDAVAVASTTEHEQLVQYNISDWDFCLLRAAVNGQLLYADGDLMATRIPDLNAEPKVVLQFGSTILEMDVEVDARQQHNGVTGVFWDPVNQEVIELEATDPAIPPPGNLTADSLAGALGDDLTRAVTDSATETEAQMALDSLLALSQLNQVGARIKCEGMAEVFAGDIVQIAGVGERFSGKAYVSAVRHDFDLIKGWKTTLQIGGIKQVYQQTLLSHKEPDVNPIGSVSGFVSGVVISNEDPAGEFRVQVALANVGIAEEGIWARVATVDAGEERGLFFRPEVGDEVVVGFFYNDPRAAVIIGMLNSSAKPAPIEPSDDNHEKGLITRSKMKILFDDEQNIMRFETPEGNSLVLDEAESALIISDQNGNTIAMTSDGIKIESAGSIELAASTEIKSESGTEMELTAGTELKLDSSLGSALSSSGTTEIKGSLVQIN